MTPLRTVCSHGFGTWKLIETFRAPKIKKQKMGICTACDITSKKVNGCNYSNYGHQRPMLFHLLLGNLNHSNNFEPSTATRGISVVHLTLNQKQMFGQQRQPKNWRQRLICWGNQLKTTTSTTGSFCRRCSKGLLQGFTSCWRVWTAIAFFPQSMYGFFRHRKTVETTCPHFQPHWGVIGSTVQQQLFE